MCRRWLISFQLISASLCVVNAKLLGLEKGSLCNGGVCELATKCATVQDIRKSRPDICGFQDKTPIICCPTAVTSSAKDSPTSTTDSPTSTTTGPTPSPVVPISQPDDQPSDSSTTSQEEVGVIARRKCLQYDAIACPSQQLKIFRFKRDQADFVQVVVGGKLAQPRDLTFMALIGYGERGSQEWECGGTVISNKWVLSAAHCQNHAQLGEAKWIRLGELDLETDQDDASPVDMAIVETVIHPDYGPEPAVYNDLVLFQSELVIIFNAYVKPICLFTYLPTPDTSPRAAGWGTTQFGGRRSSALLEVEFSFVSTRNCRDQYGRSKLLPYGIDALSQICAGTPGKDTCSGDSGGPLFQDGIHNCLKTQIGITSFGRKCGKLPGVYTWVLNYIGWIEKIVWPDEALEEESNFKPFGTLM